MSEAADLNAVLHGLAERASPLYVPLKRQLWRCADALGLAPAVGMVTTMLLRLGEDSGQDPEVVLIALAQALASNRVRISDEAHERFLATARAWRARDVDAIVALVPNLDEAHRAAYRAQVEAVLEEQLAADAALRGATETPDAQ